jgi:hypothetical protein
MHLGADNGNFKSGARRYCISIVRYLRMHKERTQSISACTVVASGLVQVLFGFATRFASHSVLG